MILLAIVVLFWGLSWYAIALQIGDVHPLVSIAWRFFIASVVLWGWLKLRGEFKPPQHKVWLQVVLLGVFLFSCNFISFYFATGFVTSGLISMVFAAAVFFTVINQWVWASVVPDRKTVIGAVLGFSGIAMLFMPSISSTLNTGQYDVLIGLGLSILGTWLFSIGNLVSASISNQMHLPSTVAVAMLVGASICAAIALLLGQSLALPFNVTYLGALAYLAVGASVVAFVAYLTLVREQGAAKAGYATALFPIVALAVSTVMEGYEWTAFAVIGVVLATLGAIIVFAPIKMKI